LVYKYTIWQPWLCGGGFQKIGGKIGIGQWIRINGGIAAAKLKQNLKQKNCISE
jgi:hypothetical protein